MGGDRMAGAPLGVMLARLFELAALVVILMVAGAVLASPELVVDQRLGVLGAIVGALLLFARVSSRRGS
jgi:hypothetical protein